MTPTESAVNNAISFECKKDALQQRQSGDWKISFTVQGIDMDDRITKAPMGTRFVAVLVAINDDESPVQQPAKEKKPEADLTAKPSLAEGRPSEKAKRDWDTFEPAQQAGMRSNDKRFAEFLQEEYPQVWREHQSSKDCIKDICVCTHSRSELGADPRKRVLWNQLDRHFDAWLIKERVGA